jgi:hypothetical protein
MDVRWVVMQVVYHNKAPTFQDEVKIKLPTRLTDKLHLLFTFYNVSVARPKKGEDELETPIGYAVLPLYENGKLPENNQVRTIRVFHMDDKWHARCERLSNGGVG